MKPGFSLTDAAFSGVHLIRREWPSVLIWAAVRLAVSVLLMAAVALVAGDDIARLAAVTATAPEQLADPTRLLDLFRGLEPIALITWPAGFLLEAVLIAALFRAYLHPERSRFGFLRLGRRELVVAGVMLLWWVLYLIALFLLTFLVLMVEPLPAAAAAVVAFVATGGFIVGFIWAAVRVSLAMVDSFDRGRVGLARSIRLTRGHFWPLLGAYILGFALTVLLSLMALAAFLIMAVVAAFAAGQDLASVGQAFNPESGALALTFSAALVVYLIYSAITGACSYPLILGPTAAAYQAFKGDDAAPSSPSREAA